MTQSIAMALHGGAGVLMPGVLTREDEQAIHAALLQALKAGVDVLKKAAAAWTPCRQAWLNSKSAPGSTPAKARYLPTVVITNWTPPS